MIALSDPDPTWPDQARTEIARWTAALGDRVVAVHHIGSTSVPDLSAKPVIDLLPVYRTESAADDSQSAVQGLGYDWLASFGVRGRRYARLDDPETGRRKFQAHGYVRRHRDVARLMAFRDALRNDPALAAEYDEVKRRCAASCRSGAQYGACKSRWIATVETAVLEARP